MPTMERACVGSVTITDRQALDPNDQNAAEAVVRWTGHPILETCHCDRYHTVPVTGQFSAEINVFITHP